MLDVRQTEQLVFTAAENIPNLEWQIEQQESFFGTLLRSNSGPLFKERS